MIESMLRRGARIPNPAGVEIDPEIDLGRISGDGVVIHAGCRILGKDTLIMPGVELGREGPVTIENCLVGPHVQLKGGFFREAVFLEKAVCGLGAHVREGTIMEEQSNIAHTVGLKQTILFPFVTLGSLINFCDCLMSGGTDRKNHSEVGSSYIHFNFTPNQDKATPSLIGDVPHGVMLNQQPIFLGGQGGMVGPVRLNFGVTVAAGTILRKDELRSNRLIIGGAPKGASIEFRRGRYSGSARIIRNNLIYIGNLIALMQWYRQVRSLFAGERFPEPLLAGLIGNLHLALEERMQRLKELAAKLSEGGDHTLRDRWPSIEEAILSRRENREDQPLREVFQGRIASAISRVGKDYLSVIKELTVAEAGQGTAWLQGIVDQTVAAALSSLEYKEAGKT
jgi:bifunctional UDP-N-acetylglucosamine pyrophosphorylase / glucosamine-1-phosphate N-acetyltransferase